MAFKFDQQTMHNTVVFAHTDSPDILNFTGYTEDTVVVYCPQIFQTQGDDYPRVYRGRDSAKQLEGFIWNAAIPVCRGVR